MAEQPTTTTPPEQAGRVLRALSDAGMYGRLSDGQLTSYEQDLIDGVWLLLRARFGLSKLDDPWGVARWQIGRAVSALDEAKAERA